MFTLDSIKIRQMSEKDIATAMKLKQAEGWNQTEKDWLLFIEHNPELCFVAFFENNVIATVTAINYGNDLAWIGMMLVLKEFRGNGISKILLKTVVAKLVQQHCVTIKLDATAAGRHVYVKIGFTEEYTIYRLVASPLMTRSIDAEMQTDSIFPLEDNDVEEVSAFDASVLGADRKLLIRFFAKNYPGRCFYSRREGRINGYVLGRTGSNYTHIGPVFAQTMDDAKALIAHSAKDLNGKPAVADVLADKEEMINWLRKSGFTKQRELYRMYYQSNPFPGKINEQFLIVGPEFG